MNELTSEHYVEGLRKAEELGIVVGDVETWAGDYFDHIARGVTTMNTRSVNSAVLPLIKLYGDPGFSFLELGQGVGVACAQVRAAAAEGSRIVSTARTPANPWYVCNITMKRLMELLNERMCEPWKGGELTIVQWLERVERERFEKKRGADTFSLEELFDLQRDFGLEIFTVLDEDSPFLDCCKVGDLPEDSLPEGSYKMVYENNGPISKSPERVRIVSMVMEALDSDGVLFLSESTQGGVALGNELREGGVLEDGDLVISLANDLSNEAGATIIAKKDSPLAVRMREHGDDCEFGGVFYIRDEIVYQQVFGVIN